MNKLKGPLLCVFILIFVLLPAKEGRSFIDIAESMESSEDPFRLYDETVLRTINLEFSQSDWWNQLQKNYNAGQNILADLIVDDVVYPDVGVRFKGTTSYRNIGDSKKKSFNIEINHTYPNQRLMGYRTLNLNNCYNDPSFIREVLYSNVSRQYILSPRANFIQLYINGENWGIYANVQQINADLIKEWFQSSDGTRWRAGDGWGQGGPGGKSNSALTWLGYDVADYKDAYDVRSNDNPDAWTGLITVCDILNNTPLGELEDSLTTAFDIDRALWSIALENVFLDEDGYIFKGADYFLYYELETGRIHLLQYDGNEVLGAARGMNVGSWGPFEGENQNNRPLINRLLSVPSLRQRYLAHMRTLLHEEFKTDVLEPKIIEYHTLISNEVYGDTKKLYSNAQFEKSFNEIQQFITDRRDFLLANSEVNRTSPVIISVDIKTSQENEYGPFPGEAVQVTAQAGNEVDIAKMTLHYAVGATGLFSPLNMYDDGQHGDGISGDLVFGAEIPPQAVGTLVRFYVEARADDGVGTMAFAPSGAEHNVITFTVQIPVADSTPVVINELMAANEETIQDPQGEYDDWIELLNISNKKVNLSGMYLSDSPDNPRKWKFPKKTKIAPGEYLLIWADEDGSDEPGLHANFKLSTSGERIMLINSDKKGNTLLDSVVFKKQKKDVSYGRKPDGKGSFRFMKNPSPGQKNGSSKSDSEK